MTVPPIPSPPSATTIDEVVALYERWGADHYDEEISQLDHALQTAALASATGASDHLVAAALLHDVGHLLELDSPADATLAADRRHEAVGVRYLAGLFPTTVTAPIALHVQAKRYRCAVDPAYHEGLSAGSVRSLVAQGGPFTPAEVARFEEHPAFADAVALRAWDDRGKVDGLAVAPLRTYEPLLLQITTRFCRC